MAKIQSRSTHLETAAKLFAIFFPPPLLGIAQVKGISKNAAPYLVLCNASCEWQGDLSWQMNIVDLYYSGH